MLSRCAYKKGKLLKRSRQVHRLILLGRGLEAFFYSCLFFFFLGGAATRNNSIYVYVSVTGIDN